MLRDSESQGNASDRSRRSFLRGAGALAVAAGPAVMMLGSASPALAGRGQNGKYGDQSGNFTSIQTHENAHVAALLAALGGNARPKPFHHARTE